MGEGAQRAPGSVREHARPNWSQWDEISKLLSGPVFSENSPLVRGAKALEAVLTNAKDMLEFIKRGGFDVIMHPLDPEARQRSIDAVKELQHERHERMTPEERAAEHAAEEKAKAAAEATRKQMEDRMEHLRKVTPPQYFSGSGGADITANMPESSNIEDRRGEFDDRAKYMKENTAELKRLNDFLIGGAAAAAARWCRRLRLPQRWGWWRWRLREPARPGRWRCWRHQHWRCRVAARSRRWCRLALALVLVRRRPARFADEAGNAIAISRR